MEDISDISPIISATIGERDLKFEKFDIYEETARLVNAELDKVQDEYNKRYHFPPS